MIEEHMKVEKDTVVDEWSDGGVVYETVVKNSKCCCCGIQSPPQKAIYLHQDSSLGAFRLPILFCFKQTARKLT